jgi:hypothetical protein
MAGRRYVRDNAGRFATVGATARGGRLRTEAGNKRATVTGMIEGAVPKGTVAKPRGMAPDKNAAVKIATNQRLRARAAAKAQAAAPQPPATQGRQRVRGNFRPQNTMARPSTGQASPFRTGAGVDPNSPNRDARLANVKAAKSWYESKGVKASVYSGDQKTQAKAFNGRNEVQINRSSAGWQDPARLAIQERRSGFWSSSSPNAVLYHERGHMRDTNSARRNTRFGESWSKANRETTMDRQLERGYEVQRMARRVSRYATHSPSEFVAETYAGIRTGRRYDHRVMNAYNETLGRRPRSVRSQIKRK